ncbi:hypothetical protein INQ16_31535, partial [Escherichia coli]|nr:hypothetical protein [Escherichia coli]
ITVTAINIGIYNNPVALLNISGIIGPLVTGFIVQFSGKYDYAFYLAGAIAIVSSLLVFVFVKNKGLKVNESQSCVHQ